MFGGGTGSSQEETGNGSGGKYIFIVLNPYLKRDCANVLILFSVNDDYQAGSSFPAFNFTGLDSISKPSGGNDMGGFGFNF